MSYEVAVVKPFLRELKRLIKKYPSLKEEIAKLRTTLEQDPFVGTAIGHGCRKIRLAMASKGKGKSGGARVITHVHIQGRMVFLLDIYDKSDKSDLAPGELDELLRAIP